LREKGEILHLIIRTIMSSN